MVSKLVQKLDTECECSWRTSVVILSDIPADACYSGEDGETNGHAVGTTASTVDNNSFAAGVVTGGAGVLLVGAVMYAFPLVGSLHTHTQMHCACSPCGCLGFAGSRCMLAE